MVRAPVLSVRSVMLFLGLMTMLVATIALPGGAGAQTEPRVVIRNVTGELSDGGTFEGRIVNPHVTYVPSTDRLKMSGTLVGTATKADGSTEPVREEFATGLQVLQGGDVVRQEERCDILRLRLGPINLNLLGLVVRIPDEIHLNIFAIPGAGNLLGNLLCAVAGLLDPNQPLADFLNGALTRLFRV